MCTKLIFGMEFLHDFGELTSFSVLSLQLDCSRISFKRSLTRNRRPGNETATPICSHVSDIRSGALTSALEPGCNVSRASTHAMFYVVARSAEGAYI